jgi:predicted RNase H-like HicB family nuclease
VTVPALPGCVTEGDTMDEALGNAREAISLYVESLEARGLPVPPSDEVVTSVEVDVHARALSI